MPTTYVILRDEHNNLVRVPTHTIPTVHYGMEEPTRYTNLLLQCEGMVVVHDDGKERSLDLHGASWLASTDDRDAQHRMDYELMVERMARRA